MNTRKKHSHKTDIHFLLKLTIFHGRKQKNRKPTFIQLNVPWEMWVCVDFIWKYRQSDEKFNISSTL